MSEDSDAMSGMQFYGVGFTSPGNLAQGQQAQRQANEMRGDVRDLIARIQRLSLLNQAMWEIMSERLGVTDADLERKAQEVDLRDGVADGRITQKAVRCPQCHRVNNSRHRQCMYCSTEFHTMLFE